jgi:glyoxylase-like metal-dependent hydrolase (beta-lactamase superfamily II)/rhodanese-related sulfurtransferase
VEEFSDLTWTAADLLSRLERREKFFVLDVRNHDEFAKFRLEGREALPSLNLPYFEMLELGAREEMVDSVVACVDQHLAEQLPRNLPILSVCAKGDTSEFVAQGLRRLGYASANLKGGMKTWGEHYATRPVVEDSALAVYQIGRPARGCLSYVAASDGKAVVIDPSRHLDPYLALARAKGLTIERVIDTHSHADHISGGPALAAATRSSYCLHPYDAVHPVDVLPARISFEPLWDGQTLPLAGHRMEVLHVPGHTLGLVALRLDDQYLFAGDSIFIRSIARPDLGGRAETWGPLHARSLRRLLDLPGQITVLPGHFSSLDEAGETGLFAAPLDTLKRTNDGLLVLQRESEEGFLRYLLGSLPGAIPEYLEIKRVNAGLVAASEDDASVLELGKNICALSQAYAIPGGGTQ